MNSTACSTLLSRPWIAGSIAFYDDSKIMVILFSDVLGDPSLPSHSAVTSYLPKESSSVSTNSVSICIISLSFRCKLSLSTLWTLSDLVPPRHAGEVGEEHVGYV